MLRIMKNKTGTTRLFKIGSTIAILLPMMLVSKANAADCNIIYEWKSCICAVTTDNGEVHKKYDVTIGGWASCDLEGCTSSNAGLSGDGYNNVTLASICLPK